MADFEEIIQSVRKDAQGRDYFLENLMDVTNINPADQMDIALRCGLLVRVCCMDGKYSHNGKDWLVPDSNLSQRLKQYDWVSDGYCPECTSVVLEESVKYVANRDLGFR